MITKANVFKEVILLCICVGEQMHKIVGNCPNSTVRRQRAVVVVQKGS